MDKGSTFKQLGSRAVRFCGSKDCYSANEFRNRFSQVKIKVTLRLTVSQSVCLGVEPNLGFLTRVFFFFSKVTVLSFLGRPL
jgi:hypothetical protein